LDGLWCGWNFSLKRPCSGRAATASTLFEFFGVIALGFYWLLKRLASFSAFFEPEIGNSTAYHFAQAFGVCVRARAVL